MDKVKISNMAIGFCGGTPIMTLDDKTTEADLCKNNIDAAINFCLEARDWTFASKRDRLTPLADTPENEFSYMFKKPSDCLVVRQVSNNIDMKNHITYQMDENNILCDYSIIYIRYTKIITNSSLFSPSFVLAAAHKLAELITSTLTGGAKDKLTFEAGAEGLLERGGAVNGMQGSPKVAYASNLMKARLGQVGNFYDYIR